MHNLVQEILNRDEYSNTKNTCRIISSIRKREYREKAKRNLSYTHI